MNVYYQIRSSQLDRSIKGLKEHFRKSSSSSGVPYSPAIPNKRKDTPTKKPVKRPGELTLTIYVAGESQGYLCPLWGEQYQSMSVVTRLLGTQDRANVPYPKGPVDSCAQQLCDFHKIWGWRDRASSVLNCL